MNITIPLSALEAGARAIREETYISNKETQKDAARAAFLAIVEAWPGAFEEYMNVEEGRAVVCTILPNGGDDE